MRVDFTVTEVHIENQLTIHPRDNISHTVLVLADIPTIPSHGTSGNSLLEEQYAYTNIAKKFLF